MDNFVIKVPHENVKSWSRKLTPSQDHGEHWEDPPSTSDYTMDNGKSRPPQIRAI